MEALLIIAVAYLATTSTRGVSADERRRGPGTPGKRCRSTGLYYLDPANAPAGCDVPHELTDELCDELGLTAGECELLKRGDYGKLGEEALERICEYLDFGGCNAIADFLASLLGGGAAATNKKLNGDAVAGDWPSGMTYEDTGGTVLNVDHYANGCEPWGAEPGWKNCFPGTREGIPGGATAPNPGKAKKPHRVCKDAPAYKPWLDQECYYTTK